MPKAVFAGCARSCAPFLDAVLANLEALGSTYDAFEVVIVENDSADDTRRKLQEYAKSRANVRLIEADGLDQAHPRRGDRLAVARNIYMKAVREPRYSDCDDLIVLDFDDVNGAPIDRTAFTAARRWLWQKADRRGVFANSTPFYYDIWALRHPSWCPDDCWGRVRTAQATMGVDEAVRRYVARLQFQIPPTTAPIMVDSAFGGLGIYRREATLESTYVGLDSQDEETCDHVAFNAGVKGSDGVLAIFPALQNRAAREHVIGALRGTKTFVLEQDGAKCRLVGPPDHPLQRLRVAHPLYQRRFPALANIVYKHAPNASLIDVGADIGHNIAFARLAGARMPAIAVEASLTCCKLLWENVERSPALFDPTRLVWGDVGAPETAGPEDLNSVAASHAKSEPAPLIERAPGVQLATLTKDVEVSLLKTRADGFDQDIMVAELAFLRTKAPILWLEAQTLSVTDESKWRSLFGTIAGQWSKMIVFDNFGFAIAAGDTGDLAGHAVDMMAYARRQRERADYRPTLYYLDVVLFPARFERAYEEFRRSIPELNA